MRRMFTALKEAAERLFSPYTTSEQLLDALRRVEGIRTAAEISERRWLEAQLRQAQKLETVGQLAGGIAHDFNNILAVILANTEMLRSALPSDRPDLSDSLDKIRAAASGGASMVRGLLTFSRRADLTVKTLDLREVVASLGQMVRALLPDDVEMRIVVPPEPCLVRGDAGALHQLLLNLVTNSRDAMPSGGNLVIGTGHVHYAPGSRLRPRELTPGDYVTISVSDTGVGMDAETRDHIFEPFYTTKPGKGTGLGLATTYGIIKQSEGSVIVESEPQHGATFRIYFPTVMREALPIREAKPGEPVSADGRRSGRILLVEDEEGLRGIARRVLARAGFDVTAASGPDEATLPFEAMTEPIDLLVTDVVMPEMRGPELAARLRDRQPGLKVLLVSGYAEEIAVVGRDASVPFLAKPFSVESLLKAVDSAMGAGDDDSAGDPEERSETAAAS